MSLRNFFSISVLITVEAIWSETALIDSLSSSYTGNERNYMSRVGDSYHASYCEVLCAGKSFWIY